MGFAVAREAFDRGADVTLVAGPDTVQPPSGPRRRAGRDRRADARGHARGRAADADVVVMAAAVADFRPEAAAEAKLKKESGAARAQLVATPDILAELGARPRATACSSGSPPRPATSRRPVARSCVRKGLDLIVANEVGRPGTGFGTDTNDAAILAAEGSDEPLRGWTKAELADRDLRPSRDAPAVGPASVTAVCSAVT